MSERLYLSPNLEDFLDFELQPRTDPGRRFVALAEEHAPGLSERAAQHDREGSFPSEGFEALRASGLLAACVPTELGGLGVTSVHDFSVGVNRLGRGDGSTAIAANMHISQVWLLANYWRMMKAASHPGARGLEALLLNMGKGRGLMSSTVAEPGTDILHPYVKATRDGKGWRLNGRKVFGTLLPMADAMQVTCQAETPEGPAFAIVTVPRNVPGVDVKDDWDALGMRASGSHSVEYTDVAVPEHSLNVLGPWGTWNEPYLFGNIVITLGLVASFLGIAEAARDMIIATMKSPRRGTDRTPAQRYAVQYGVAHIEIDVAACRAMVARTAIATDDFAAEYQMGVTPIGELHALMKDFQCTKTLVTRQAVEVVDRALTLSGGAGYMSRNPLARLYRDVRAGPFMQPYSPNEAYEYIGRVTLGLDPDLADYRRTPE